MGCFTYNGVNFDSKEDFLIELQQELSEFNLNGNVDLKADGSSFLLLPDMVTKLEVKIGSDNFNFTYKELLFYIETQLEDKSPARRINKILKGDDAIKISVPLIQQTFSKKFHSFSTDGLTSDTIVEATIVKGPDKGKSYLGTVDFINEYDFNENSIIAYSVVEKEIIGERELKGYDYRGADDLSISDTKEGVALFEMSNGKPKNKKFSDDIVAIYLMEVTDLSNEQINSIIERYNSLFSNQELIEGVSVKQFTENITSFLGHLNIYKEQLSEEDKDNSYKKKIIESQFNNSYQAKKKEYYSLLRYNVIRRILNDDFNFTPSEIISSIPNIAILDINENHTKKDVEGVWDTLEKRNENIKTYFLNRESETKNHLRKSPMGEKLASILDNTINLKEDNKENTRLFRNIIGEFLSKDYSDWKWFAELQLYVIENKDDLSFNDFRFKLNKAFKSMNNDVSGMKLSGYESSLLSIYTRIPSQAKQSTSVGKLSDFTNKRKNFAMESLKSFMIKGQDSDGDKLNTMSVELDIHGNPVSYLEYLNDNGEFNGLNNNDVISFNERVLPLIERAVINKLKENNKKVTGYSEKIDKLLDLRAKKDTLDLVGKLELKELQVWLSEELNSIEILKISQDTLTSEKAIISKIKDNIVLKAKLDAIEKNRKEEANDEFTYIEALRIKPGKEAFSRARKFITLIDKKYNKKKENEVAKFTKAVNNFILDKQIQIHSDPLNAIEKEIKVASDEIDSILESGGLSDERFENSKINPDVQGPQAQVKVIHLGDNEVSKVANALRLASTLSELGQKVYSLDSNSKTLDTNVTMDFSYTSPIIDEVTGERVYATKEILINDIRPFNEGKQLAGIDLKNNHIDELDLRTLSDFLKLKYKKDASLKVTENDVKIFFSDNNELLELSDKLKKGDIDFIEFTNLLYNTQIFESLSELMTGAVDNAKLLILGQLGITSTLHTHILTMINVGVSLRDALAFISQKDIQNAINEYEVNNVANKKSKSLSKILKVKSDNREFENRKTRNKIKTRESELTNLVLFKELSLLNNSVFNNEITLFTDSSSKVSELGNVNSVNSEYSDINTSIVDGINNVDTGLIIVENEDAMLNKLKDIAELVSNNKSIFFSTRSGDTIFMYLNGRLEKLTNNNNTNLGLSDLVLGGDIYIYNDTDMDSNSVSELLNMLDNAKVNLSDSIGAFYEDRLNTLNENTKEKLDIINPDFNPAKKFLDLMNITNEFSLIINVMGFKNSKNNSQYNMHNYINRIEGKAKGLLKGIGEDTLSNEFSIYKFMFDKEYQTNVSSIFTTKKQVVNPFFVILQSEELHSFLKTFATQEHELTLTSNKKKSFDIIANKLLPMSVKQKTYSNLKKAVDALTVNDFLDSYFKGDKTIKLHGLKDEKGNVIKFKLNTIEGSLDFLKSMPKVIQNLQSSSSRLGYNIKDERTNTSYKKNYNENPFIKSLTLQGVTNDKFGENFAFVKLGKDFKENESIIKSAAEELKEHNKDLYKALYFYSLMTSSNSSSIDGLNNVLKAEDEYNIETFLNDYNFSKIDKADANYLILTNPSLVRDLDNVNVSLHMNKGLVYNKINLSYNNKNNLFNFVPIVRVSALNAYRPFLTKIDIDGVKEKGKVVKPGLTRIQVLDLAGYKIGHQVVVSNNPNKDEIRVIAYNNKEDKYYLYNYNTHKVEERTTTELKDLNPNFVFDKSNFGPKNITSESKLDKKVFLSEKEKKAYFSNNANKKIIGIYDDSWENYHKGQKIDGFTDSHGRVFNVIYNGTINFSNKKRRNHPLGNSIPLEGNMNKLFFGEEYDAKLGLDKNTQFVIADIVEVTGYRIPIKNDYARISDKISKKYHLSTQLTKKNIQERALMIYAVDRILDDVSSVEYTGTEKYIRTEDRNYIIKSKGYFKTPQEAIENFGFNKGAKGLKQLSVFLNIDQFDKDTNTFIYKWLNQTSSETELKGVILFDVIPQSLRGFNNTIDELKSIKDIELDSRTVETVLAGTELYLQIKYISATDINNSHLSLIKENNYNKKGVDAFKDISKKVSSDIELMKNKSDILEEVRFSNVEATEKEYVRETFNKLSGTDLNIVYVDDILAITSSDILSGNTYSLRRAAVSQGKIIPGLLQSDIDFLLSEYNDGKTINFDKDYNGVYSYIPAELRTEEILAVAKQELSDYLNTSYGELGNNSKGYIGIEQKIYTSKSEESFITLQTAKHISHTEDTELYLINQTNGQIFLYDNSTGHTKAINSIPNIAGKKVGIVSDYRDANNLLKFTANNKLRGMDPSFIMYNNFIYNKDEAYEEHDLIDTYSNTTNVEAFFDEITTETRGSGGPIYIDKNGKQFVNDDFVDLGNGYVLKVYKFKSGEITVLESEGSPYVYLINDKNNPPTGMSKFEKVRTQDLDFIGEGSLKTDYKIKFLLHQKNKDLLNHTMYASAKSIYKVDKEAFLNATNTNGENAELKTYVDKVKAFSEKDVAGTEYNFKDIVSSIKQALPELDSNGDIVYEKNINSAVDLISFIISGKLDSILSGTSINVNGVYYEYDALKTEVIKLNNELNSLKKSYYDKRKEYQDKNMPTINMVTSSNFKEVDGEKVKVYFSKLNASNKTDIVNANKSEDFELKSVEIGDPNKVFPITVANQFGPLSKKNLDIKVGNFFRSIENHFKTNSESKKVFYVNFGEIDELYKDTSLSFIAKSFARKLKNGDFYNLVKSGKILFNEKATIEINSTDGYNSVTDINSNRIFKTVSIMNPTTVMKLPYAFLPQNLELDKDTGNTVMQEFKEYYNIPENENVGVLNIPIDLGKGTLEDVQTKLTQLYRNYFSRHPEKLLEIQMKMKSRDLFVYNQSYVTPQTSIVDIINDKNSIDFLFNKKINASDLKFFNKEKSLLLIREEEELPGIEKKNNNSIPVVSEGGDIYKVEYRYVNIVPMVETENGMDLNPILKAFGFVNSDITSMKDLGKEERLTVISSTKLDTNLELIDDVKYSVKEIIEDKKIIPNPNLGEENAIKANYVFVLNVKNTTTSNKGLTKSKDLTPYIKAYGNTIKTNLTEDDIIHIKSSHVGDMEGLSNNEYYDAFIKMKPYIDNIVLSKAKVILSKGVTVNEYIKEYLYKSGYVFDGTSGMFIYKEVGYIEDTKGIPVYKYLDKEKEGNRIFAINNNERGKTLLPLIVHLDPDKAVSHINDYVINEDNKVNDEALIPMNINPDKIIHKNSIIDLEVSNSIISDIFGDKLDNVNISDVDIIINKLEQSSIGYIKLTIGLHLFGDKLDFSKIKNSDDLFIAVNNYVKANEKLPIIKKYKNNIANYIDADNKLTVGIFKKTAMLYNNNNINEFLLHDLNIDYKTMFKNYPLLEEVNAQNTYLINFDVKKKILVNNNNINNFKNEEVNALDLFLFTMSFNPETSFTKGKPNPMPTMHLFTSKGIEGLDLDSNGYSLFDTMGIKYEDNATPIIYGPKFAYKPVGKNIEKLFYNLNKKDSNLAFAINNTKTTNLPFIVSDNEVHFDNGTILNVNEVSKFKDEFKKIILIKALSEIGINTSSINEMLNEDVGANILSIFKTNKSFNTVNANRVLFRGFTEKSLSITNLEPGTIIYTENEEEGKDNINGFIFNKNDKKFILQSNGNTKEIVTENGNLTLKDTDANAGVNFKPEDNKVSLSENYAVPNIGVYSKIRIYNHAVNTYTEFNGSIDVLSTGVAVIDNKSYNYNSVYGAWELISSDFGLTYGSKKVLNGTRSNISTNEDLKGIRTLSLDNGFVIELSDNAEIIEGNVVDGDKTYVFNSKTLSYQLKIEGEPYFKFKSDIESIQINGNTIEAIKLDKKQTVKFVNEMAKLYPNVNISLKNSVEIEAEYGKSKRNRKGFVKGNEIVYNTDLLTGETAIHEFAHIYMENLKTTNPEAYMALLSKATENKALFDHISKNNKDLDEYDVLEEVIVTMIGFNTQGTMTNLIEKKSLWQDILDFFNNIINNIFEVEVNIDLNKSLNDITKEIGSDIINNKSNLFSGLSSNDLIILGDKVNITAKRESALRKLISMGNIKLKSSVDYTKVETVKCN